MSDTRSLEKLQRWMLAAITDPHGALLSEANAAILPSQQQSSEERLGVYRSAYFARLLEVLRELFPCTRFAVGDELFDEFAAGYLEQHPPRSYTLSRLADKLAEYLETTRPADWGGFVVELVRLEHAIDRIFDGPGPEGLPEFVVPSNADSELGLTFVPGCELFSFAYPVSAYYTAWKRASDPAWPEPGQQFVALFRRDYVVRRLELTEVQFQILSALEKGATLGESLESAAEGGAVKEPLTADQVGLWFRQWAAQGLFAGINSSWQAG